MRFVFVFITGIAAGYTLHIKKDKTIDSVAGSVADFLEHQVAGRLRSAVQSY